MFNFISAFIRIYRSCIFHSSRRGMKNRISALKSAVMNARTVASVPCPIPWEKSQGLEETYRPAIPMGNDYYWLVATSKGFLPLPWWEEYAFMDDNFLVVSANDAMQVERIYIYGK